MAAAHECFTSIFVKPKWRKPERREGVPKRSTSAFQLPPYLCPRSWCPSRCVKHQHSVHSHPRDLFSASESHFRNDGPQALASTVAIRNFRFQLMGIFEQDLPWTTTKLLNLNTLCSFARPRAFQNASKPETVSVLARDCLSWVPTLKSPIV